MGETPEPRKENQMEMKTFAIAMSLGASVLGAAQAMADHNSKNGEGWALMPNDIHNMRIDTRESDDLEEFQDFVQYGSGSDSVNRFEPSDRGSATGSGSAR